MLKNRNYDNDNDKLRFTKTLISQKYENVLPENTPIVAVPSDFFTLDFYNV